MVRMGLSILLLCMSMALCAADGKLLATPGVSQLEGSAGGGIVPWATIAGYATDDQWATTGFCSYATVPDYSLKVCGVQFNVYDRIELSIAKQSFRVDALNSDLEQTISGVKVRVYGDLVYSTGPLISLGLQHKSLDNGTIPRLLGAQEISGNDFYIAATKLHLGALNGLNLLWNVSARNSKANEIGLLGFGGPQGGRQWLFESSGAVFLDRHWALGAEFREKTDRLNLGEDHWKDVFVAWIPNKSVSVTLAYVDLGRIAGVDGQSGWYASAEGYW